MPFWHLLFSGPYSILFDRNEDEQIKRKCKNFQHHHRLNLIFSSTSTSTQLFWAYSFVWAAYLYVFLLHISPRSPWKKSSSMCCMQFNCWVHVRTASVSTPWGPKHPKKERKREKARTPKNAMKKILPFDWLRVRTTYMLAVACIARHSGANVLWECLAIVWMDFLSLLFVPWPDISRFQCLNILLSTFLNYKEFID